MCIFLYLKHKITYSYPLRNVLLPDFVTVSTPPQGTIPFPHNVIKHLQSAGKSERIIIIFEECFMSYVTLVICNIISCYHIRAGYIQRLRRNISYFGLQLGVWRSEPSAHLSQIAALGLTDLLVPCLRNFLVVRAFQVRIENSLSK